jgi:Flp pilus assembly protein TadB
MIAALVVFLVVTVSWPLAAPLGRTAVTGATSEPTLATRSAARAGQAGGLTVILVVGVLLLGGVPVAALLATTVVGRRWMRVRRTRRARRRLDVQFPDVVDLFVVAVRAGLLPAIAI